MQRQQIGTTGTNGMQSGIDRRVQGLSKTVGADELPVAATSGTATDNAPVLVGNSSERLRATDVDASDKPRH
jgi:hypothetical protein